MSAKTAPKKVTTKPEIILKLVQRKNGATIKSMQDATGWQPHSIRAALTGLRKKGRFIKRTKDGRGFTVYRLSE